jgi:hypothetical protein
MSKRVIGDTSTHLSESSLNPTRRQAREILSSDPYESWRDGYYQDTRRRGSGRTNPRKILK